MTPECWFAPRFDALLRDRPNGYGLRKCDGPMTRCHLVPKQLIRRECKHSDLPLRLLLEDPRAWVWGCLKHHELLDRARCLKIPRRLIPPETFDFADELGLSWWMEREYGLEVPA